MGAWTLIYAPSRDSAASGCKPSKRRSKYCHLLPTYHHFFNSIIISLTAFVITLSRAAHLQSDTHVFHGFSVIFRAPRALQTL